MSFPERSDRNTKSFRGAKRRRNLRRRLHMETAPIHLAKPFKIATRPAAARNDDGKALCMTELCHFLGINSGLFL